MCLSHHHQARSNLLLQCLYTGSLVGLKRSLWAMVRSNKQREAREGI